MLKPKIDLEQYRDFWISVPWRGYAETVLRKKGIDNYGISVPWRGYAETMSSAIFPRATRFPSPGGDMLKQQTFTNSFACSKQKFIQVALFLFISISNCTHKNKVLGQKSSFFRCESPFFIACRSEKIRASHRNSASARKHLRRRKSRPRPPRCCR